MNITHTRNMVRAAINGDLATSDGRSIRSSALAVPTEVPGVPAEVLIPRDTWADPAEYDAAARRIARMFHENFEAYADRRQRGRSVRRARSAVDAGGRRRRRCPDRADGLRREIAHGRNKVTVIGAGNVGATTAQRIAEAGLADVVLVDIVEGLPQGKGLDLAEAAPVVGHDARIIGTNDYADTAGSDIIVVTSGLARQPGMSRDDLLAKNAGIVQAVVEQAAQALPERGPDHRHEPARRDVPRRDAGLGLPARARPRHGRRPRLRAVPDVHRRRSSASPSRTPTPSSSAATATRWSRCRATRRSRASRSRSCCSPERVQALVERTANGGAEIVALLKTGSAFYAPAASTFEMVDAILLDRKRVLPCAVHLQGEYGVDGLFVGVPVVLGAGGIERVIEIKLSADEQAAFDKSAASVRELVDQALATDEPSSGGPGRCPDPYTRTRESGHHHARVRPRPEAHGHVIGAVRDDRAGRRPARRAHPGGSGWPAHARDRPVRAGSRAPRGRPDVHRRRGGAGSAHRWPAGLRSRAPRLLP